MNHHMKRRHGGHSGHMNPGMGNGGRNRQQGRYGFQKPRKNYPALREKYLNMAKDAMSSGDRVLAEYYLQHADHYFRVQQEFFAERAARQQQQPQGENMPDEGPEEAAEEEVNISSSSGGALPAFITRQVPAQPSTEEKPAGWEED